MKKDSVEKHFDKVAVGYDVGKSKYPYYYESLKKLLGTLIPNNKKVFEIGCGTGDLLASLKPKYGYGMDISKEMIRIANVKHSKESQIHFSTEWPKEKFDYIFMSDVIEHLDRPKEMFRKISRLMDKKSKFIITMANPIWEPLLMIWEKLGWKMPEGPHTRIKNKELKIMMKKAGLKIVKHDYRLLIPIYIPFITDFVNKCFERSFKKLAFIEYFITVKS